LYEGGGYVVLRTDRTLAQSALLEPRLTELCRYNMFHHQRDGWFYAAFADQRLGVGFGHGLGLYDPAQAADRSRIYVFLRAASTAPSHRAGPWSLWSTHSSAETRRATARPGGRAGTGAPPGRCSGISRRRW